MGWSEASQPVQGRKQAQKKQCSDGRCRGIGKLIFYFLETRNNNHELQNT